jgi:hypothetical protein
MVLALGLLIVGVLSRFLPHADNFTPVLALAFFGGVFLRHSHALVLPLGLMMCSDLFLGIHPMIPFTWGSLFLISFMGLKWRDQVNVQTVFAGSLIGAVIFFMVTNFGAWLAYYPLTWEGFVTCYVMAIPFFRNTLVSTLVYTGILFGVYELLARRIRSTRLAPVLLN